MCIHGEREPKATKIRKRNKKAHNFGRRKVVILESWKAFQTLNIKYFKQ